jgi:hypothetical protein
MVPPSFEGPVGTREVHTEVRQLNLTHSSGAAVRAGSGLELPISPGEVESLSGASGDANQDFPAESFFDVFVEVELPGLGGLNIATLFNSDPMLVQNDNLAKFPPKVVYIHGNTVAVPVYFKDDNPGVWQVGDRFGWLVLAGHGVSFNPDNPDDINEFVEITTAQPEMPLPDTLGDVNGNGQITAYDASLILQHVVGLRELSNLERARADVSGDDTISSLDAALVLQYAVGLITSFPAADSAPVAPVMNPTIESELLARIVEQLENTNLTEEQQQVLKHLKNLIFNQLIPNHTALFSNFPNPFNPETWIPFQLAQNAPVSIKIYDTKGQLIRAILLGNRNAGIYTTKSKAGHWDGRNSLGEKVSSGMYYYTLQAGEFSSTRKMVITK